MDDMEAHRRHQSSNVKALSRAGDLARKLS
jgi:hypothetical protein